MEIVNPIVDELRRPMLVYIVVCTVCKESPTKVDPLFGSRSNHIGGGVKHPSLHLLGTAQLNQALVG